MGKYNTKIKYKYNVGDRIKNEQIDITITERRHIENNYGWVVKLYKYKCNLCGFDCGKHYSNRDKIHKDEFWVRESSIIENRKCICCSNQIVVENINSIYHTDPWMISYIGEECAKIHTKCSSRKVEVTCPDCGRKKSNEMFIYTLFKEHSIGCSCGDGMNYPNKFMFNLLEQLNIDFINEYSPNWIIPRAYDFYISSLSLIIEMDGGLGHGKGNYKNNMTAEESQTIDDYKDEQAKLHGIEVIRIDCDYKHFDKFEYIKQNIITKIKNIIDLSNIDWNKCQEFACSNLVKMACEYKKNNPELTTTQIGKIMNRNPHTIWSWLKQGAGIWCDYNPNEEKLKNFLKQKVRNKINKSKPVLCITTGQAFLSACECDRLSIELFGTYLNQSNISQVCRNKKKFYKGYEFKFITKEEFQKYSQMEVR
jgi:hypothetical protein